MRDGVVVLQAVECYKSLIAEAKRRILRARESPAVTQLTALINALVCFPPSAPGCCDMSGACDCSAIPSPVCKPHSFWFLATIPTLSAAALRS